MTLSEYIRELESAITELKAAHYMAQVQDFADKTIPDYARTPAVERFMDKLQTEYNGKLMLGYRIIEEANSKYFKKTQDESTDKV